MDPEITCQEKTDDYKEQLKSLRFYRTTPITGQDRFATLDMGGDQRDACAGCAVACDAAELPVFGFWAKMGTQTAGYLSNVRIYKGADWLGFAWLTDPAKYNAHDHLNCSYTMKGWTALGDPTAWKWYEIAQCKTDGACRTYRFRINGTIVWTHASAQPMMAEWDEIRIVGPIGWRLDIIVDYLRVKATWEFPPT